MKNQEGISFFEVLTVVTVLGVVLTLALPYFIRFKARAYQTYAKSELAQIYTAQKVFKHQHNTYHSNLALIGFIPAGFPLDASKKCPDFTKPVPTRFYAVGFRCFMGDDCKKPARPYDVVDGLEFPCGVSQKTTMFPMKQRGSEDLLWVLGSSQIGPSRFKAAAMGLLPAGAGQDVWKIDQDRILENNPSALE